MPLNFNTLKTPGVYIDEVSLLPPSVVGVETGIPAFIGYTEKTTTLGGTTDDLKNVPKKIFSFLEFEDLYGKPQAEDKGLKVKITDTLDAKSQVTNTVISAEFDEAERSKHIMYYSIQLYFANGGGPCYIISVGVYSTDGKTVSKNDLNAGLEALANEDEPTIIVIPEATFLGDLTNPAEYYDVFKTALDQAAKLQDRFVLIDVRQENVLNNKPDFNKDFKEFRERTPVDNLRYGAAYYPMLLTTIDFNYTGKEGDVIIENKQFKPDGTHTPGSNDGKKLSDIETTDNILYERAKQALTQISMKLPPSPAIAGIYAKVDSERGVWKAPANVSVGAVVSPSIKIDDSIQASMNVDATTGKSINAIRYITGRGTVVWGARTLAGNDNEWRYINVRRFFNFVEESVKKATYQFVFESNDANTWIKIRAMVENFLTLQWRQGALQGSKPEQAFFVRVGLGQTMTPQDILEGRLIVEIGMAVVRPAEFIILRFMHKLPEA